LTKVGDARKKSSENIERKLGFFGKLPTFWGDTFLFALFYFIVSKFSKKIIVKKYVYRKKCSNKILL